MSRIEIEMSEYQGMKKKIKNLESALNSVSKEASISKEKLGQLKALIFDLENEGIFNRLFTWAKIISPLKKLVTNAQEEKEQTT